MAVIDLATSARRLYRGRSRPSLRPPRPHDPDERILVDTCPPGLGVPTYRHWEVRLFDPAGLFHFYFGAKGMLHLQLWHPWSGVSLLTPSRLTSARYEVFPVAGWKLAATDYAELVAAVHAEHGITLPAAEALAGLCRAHGVDEPPEAGILAAASVAPRPPYPLVGHD